MSLNFAQTSLYDPCISNTVIKSFKAGQYFCKEGSNSLLIHMIINKTMKVCHAQHLATFA